MYDCNSPEALLIASQLKPFCIELSQLALRDGAKADDHKALRESTSKLLKVLEEKCSYEDGRFDVKLANYVFFPLSHVLRSCQKTPGRLAELAVLCLKLILRYGWRKGVPLDLAVQLMLLLTFFSGGGGVTDATISEELQTYAYEALSLLFNDIRVTAKGSVTLTEASTIPALGHCLTTILSGMTDGPTAQCQQEAIAALKSLWLCLKDQQALSTFLPGTVSSLTKTLMPTIRAPRSRKSLIEALEAFQIVITICLNDLRTSNLPDDKKNVGQFISPTLNKTWLRATASQVKLALANIIKLRTHGHQDVRSALSTACLVLLDECNLSLIESAPMLVETIIVVGSKEHSSPPKQRIELIHLALIHDSIAEIVKTTIYNWVTSFPRIMQSNDESVKQDAMQQLSLAYGLFSDFSMDSRVLEDAIAESLLNGVSALLEVSHQKTMIEESIPFNFDGSFLVAQDKQAFRTFKPVLMERESQDQTRKQLESLIKTLGSGQTQLRMSGALAMRFENETGTAKLTSLWLSFQLLKASATTSKEFEEFVDLALSSTDEETHVTDDLFYVSLALLSEDSEDDREDWRLKAIALEVVAYKAHTVKDGFRMELIDCLYPVVQLLGSSNSKLRDHAISSLDMMSSACGYKDTSDMIVENVDYLVNAISLKLNTFDISITAPQILIMMIKLSGSSLLPYLDDVVGSIFSALDNFHGYPRLVETLFSVLAEIVDQGSNSGQLSLMHGRTVSHRKLPPNSPSIAEIARVIGESRAKRSRETMTKHEDFPREQWKSAKQLLDEKDALSDSESKQGNEEQKEEHNVVTKAPPTRIYTMLQNIARLGQHYLTSQSPLLRRRLLALIRVACTALHGDEDEFLPLVNDLWPVLIKRLQDDETFVVIEALSCIAELCRCAGNFVATRFQAEWADLMRLMTKAKTRALAEKRGKNTRGIYAQNSQVWEAFIDLLVTLVEYVRISEEMFDEVLDLLGDILEREDIYSALSVVNPDAVWLEKMKRGMELRAVPSMEGYTFACS